ncbi:MAG: hypothetical protein AAF603_08160, partial [Pseudomonadota bacterium]
MFFKSGMHGLFPSALIATLAMGHAAADIPQADLEQNGAAGMVKEICSAVFVSNRDVDQFLEVSSSFWLTAEQRNNLPDADLKIDRDQKTVSLTFPDGASGTASYFDGLGCVSHRSSDLANIRELQNRLSS